MLKKFLYFILLLPFIFTSTYSQPKTNISAISGQTNVIVSAVPFLTIAPDSRSGAMGDAGVAISPDANSMHWNPAKYAFIEEEMGVSFSYTPWLRNLVGDMDLALLTGYKRIDKRQVIAASLLYFALGDIEFTDKNGDPMNTAKPNEFAIDVAYSRTLGKNFSGGLAFRFIRSDLSNGFEGTQAGTSFAADVSAYYNKEVKISDYDGKLAFGVNISNMGNKMTYTKKDDNKDFIPTNLRIGSALTLDMDKYNSFTATIDLNKALIPSPYTLGKDTAGNAAAVPANFNGSMLSGMFKSFTDAPGGFKEELHEIAYSAGVEYLYRKQFAIRAGYYNEYVTKGNRKFFTAGLGVRFNVFSLDFSYLIPQQANNPLANTLRFSLNFNFDAFRKLNRR